MEKVFVLLSTYNGEKFLSRQLDSILGQSGVDVHLMVRDDGSTDNTVALLKRYARENSNMSVFLGENVGYIKSFMWLVNNCPCVSKAYYAFSDQDDFWLPEKLLSAVEMLQQTDSSLPACYYSDLDVVDAEENFIRKANAWEGKIDKYMLSVFIGIRGCTMVYNDALQRLLAPIQVGEISGHDTYVALVAFWLGTVVYDNRSYILYRQTGSNLSITSTNPLDHLLKNFDYLSRRLGPRSNIHEKNAREVLRNYEAVYPDKLAELRAVALYRESLGKRFHLIIDSKFKSFSPIIRLFNDVLILLGKL